MKILKQLTFNYTSGPSNQLLNKRNGIDTFKIKV